MGEADDREAMANCETPKPFKLDHCQPPDAPSSRRSAFWAGWSTSRAAYHASSDAKPDAGWCWVDDASRHGRWDELLEKRINPRWRDFSWLTTNALLDSANDRIAMVINDLVAPRRMRWVAAQRAAGVDASFVVDQRSCRKFLIVGDPGEADGSQYAVVDPLCSVESEFMVILSDVIYPAGDINDYLNGFYIPFEQYRKPIFALPGNHDWYDGLNGFMFHFCGAEALPPTEYRRTSYSAPERIARQLWRQADRPMRTRLLQHRAQRKASVDDQWKAGQPGPYYALDIAGVRLVAIDTGIAGTIDSEQGEWLSRVSREKPDTPKVLLTGKPIWVDGGYKPTPIEWEPGALGPHSYETVDDVVRDPRNRYVAAIGGDVHNYQRYTVTVENERESATNGEPGCGKTRRKVEYIVSGGGGAYMSATHRIAKVDNVVRESRPDQLKRLAGIQKRGNYRHAKYKPPRTVGAVTEEQFRCYPVRGDSLAYYARWFVPRLFAACGALFVATVALALAAWVVWEKSDGQTVWEVAAAAVGGLIGSAIAVGLLVAVARLPAPRGYRTAVILLAVPTGIAGLAFLLDLWEAWDWIWRVLLLTLGTVAIPLAVTLAGYYGLGSNTPGSGGRMPRHLVTALLFVAMVAVVFFPLESYDTATEIASAVVVAAVAVVLVLLALGWGADPVGKWIVRGHAALPWLAAVGGYALFIVPLVLKFQDDSWAVRVMVVAAAAVSALLTLVLLAWVAGFAGRKTLLLRSRIDPNKAIRYVQEKYGSAEGVREAAAETDWRTRAIGHYLLPRPPAKNGLVRRIRAAHPNAKISEVGNADKPSMFKNFLQVETLENDTKLKITCYGVTGWECHDGRDGRPVPVEDCVEIDLAEARGNSSRTPAHDGQVHFPTA
jgi:hypothetical protein